MLPKQNLGIANLVKHGWFQPYTMAQSSRHRKTGTTPDPIANRDAKYYFKDANLQTTLLGNMFLQPRWVVCSLRRLPAQIRLGLSLLNASTPDDAIPNERPARYNGTAAFKERVPWADVESYYLADLGFFNEVEQRGGCVWRSDDAGLDRRLGEELGRASIRGVT